MSGILPGLPIIQVGLVVNDLEAYATRQSQLLGNGPWRVYEFGPHMMGRYDVLSSDEGFGAEGAGGSRTWTPRPHSG